MPQVSIIMATYNRAHLIGETLHSILKQNLEDWECIIIDDGSTDNTAEVVKGYTSRDPRFQYISRNINYKKGLPGCRNHGLDIAKGEYFIFFDDDDIVHPHNLDICLDQLSDPQLKFCRYDKKPFSGNAPHNFDGHLPLKKCFFDIQKIDKMITGEIAFASCCVMWKKCCFDRVRFKEDLMYAEEWECYGRILSKGLKGVSIDSILYYNRKHQHSNTGEFRNGNASRLNSQIKAAHLVVDNLREKRIFNKKLKRFFVRMAIELKSGLLLQKSLKASGANKFERLKYELGYKFYPLIKPVFYLKGKILRN
jgi:GalNAc5-diNAcBac-PP-undecaprenol beta-1,3-glucosyltransferase